MINVKTETKKLLLQYLDETEIYLVGDDRFINGQISPGENLDINFSYNNMIHEAIIRATYNTRKIELDVIVCNRPNIIEFPVFINMIIGIITDYNNYKGKEFCMKLLLDL